jgi:hypothetical protein
LGPSLERGKINMKEKKKRKERKNPKLRNKFEIILYLLIKSKLEWVGVMRQFF